MSVIPSTGQVGLSHLRAVLGNPTGAVSLGEFYSNAPQQYALGIVGIPSRGNALGLGHFRGKSKGSTVNSGSTNPSYTSVVLSWIPGINTSYYIVSWTGGSTGQSAQITQQTTTITGLLSGSSYTFVITPYNSLGVAGIPLSISSTLLTGAYTFTSHKFTNCGVTGTTGPNLQTCVNNYNTFYNNSSGWWTTSALSVSGGIQRWRVPYTGTYSVKIAGAAGGFANGMRGGYGRIITANVTLTQDEVISILCGHLGGIVYGNYNGNVVNNPSASTMFFAGGGGGGSFMVDSSNNPILVAGGGGGATWGNWPGGSPSTVNFNGGDAASFNSTSGMNPPTGWSNTNVPSGQMGLGGTNGNSGTTGNGGGTGGAGFTGAAPTQWLGTSSNGNGSVLYPNSRFGGYAGQPYMSGGGGGDNSGHITTGAFSSIVNSPGGFGGGSGGGLLCYIAVSGGGGGGYSGGGGGYGLGPSGGGGNFIGSARVSNAANGGENVTHGYVEITFVG